MAEKEVYRSGLRIEEVAGNCFVSAATCAFRYLSGGMDWDADQIRGLLPLTNTYYFSMVARAIEAETGLRFERERVATMVIRQHLRGRLSAGGMCLLSVKSRGWVGKVVGDDISRIRKDETHAVLVTGYYEPKGTWGEMWLYIADSYGEKLRFLNLKSVVGHLDDFAWETEVGCYSPTKEPRDGLSDWERWWHDGAQQVCFDRTVNLAQKSEGGLVRK